jgi:predicted phosphodiesterase
MRYLILADMHGNWTALQTVLEHASSEGYDEALVLGDLVGYGAEPNQVVAAIRDLAGPARVIRGNHDKVVAGLDDGASFNPTALPAAQWPREELSDDNLTYVRELQEGPVIIDEDLVICHGSPLDEDEYLLSAAEAEDVFESQAAQVTFFGHTHLPSSFTYSAAGVEGRLLEGARLAVPLEPESRYLLNPGSVGQPRDRDPRASFMIFDRDEQTAHLYRLDYPVTESQEKIRRAGLPEILADRLVLGI